MQKQSVEKVKVFALSRLKNHIINGKNIYTAN